MNFEPISTLENLSQNQIYQSIQGRLPTEQEINDVVEYYRSLLNITPADAEKVIASLQSRLIVSMDTGDSINKKETYRPWLSNKKAGFEFFYWNRYAKYLEIDKKWSKGVVATIDEVSDRVLDLLGDPTETGAWQRRGLSVLYVVMGQITRERILKLRKFEKNVVTRIGLPLLVEERTLIKGNR